MTVLFYSDGIAIDHSYLGPVNVTYMSYSSFSNLESSAGSFALAKMCRFLLPVANNCYSAGGTANRQLTIRKLAISASALIVVICQAYGR